MSRRYTALVLRGLEEYLWGKHEEGIDGMDDIAVVVDIASTTLETVDDASVEMESRKLEEVYVAFCASSSETLTFRSQKEVPP